MSEPSLEGAFCPTHSGVEAAILCSRCGSYACEACTFIKGARRSFCRECASGGLDRPVPWERRREIGLLAAYWQTTKLVMSAPTKFYRTPPTESGFASSLLFGALAVTVAHLGIAILMTLLIAGAGLFVGLAALNESSSPDGAYAGGAMICVGFGYGLLTLVQAPLYGLLVSLVAAGLEHLGLVLVKARRATFEDTWRAVSYANASYILWWIPFVGMLITLVWVPTSEVIALREIHRAKTDRVTLVVVGWRILFVVAMTSLYAALIIAAMLIPQQ